MKSSFGYELTSSQLWVTWQLELHEKPHKTGNQEIIIDVFRKLWYIEIETTRKNAF